MTTQKGSHAWERAIRNACQSPAPLTAMDRRILKRSSIPKYRREDAEARDFELVLRFTFSQARHSVPRIRIEVIGPVPYG